MLFFTIRLNNTAFTAYSYVWFSTFLGLVLELLFLGLDFLLYVKLDRVYVRT